MMEFIYTEFAKGVRDRGHVIPYTDIQIELEAIPPQERVDIFINTLLFDRTFVEYVRNTGSVSGYLGPAYMLYFPIDVDGHEDSLYVARDIINFLEDNEVPVEYLRIFFSGNKGFHIMIPNAMIGAEPSESISAYMRNFYELLLGKELVDSSIYNHVRLFRYPNTIHSKSGLYKRELTLQQLKSLTYSEIMELAKSPYDGEIKYYRGGKINFLHQYWREAVNRSKTIVTQINISDNDAPEDAKYYCYKAIFRKGAEEGYRNETALRAAWILKKTGLPFELAVDTMKRWNTLNKPPLPDKEIETVVKHIYENDYKFGCSDRILSRYCNTECPIYAIRMRKQEEKKEVYNFHQLAISYMNFAKIWATQAIPFGHEAIDKHFRGLLPGFLVYVLARPGVGKTSFAIDLLHKLAERKIPTVFFSLEMSKAMIFERMTSRALLIPQDEMVQYALKDDFMQMIEKASECYQTVIVNEKAGVDLEYIKNYVKLVENSILGRKVRVVIIDHFTALTVDGGSPYEQASKKAIGLQRLAKELEVSFVVLTHTNRQAGRGDVEVDINMGRDSSIIEDTADLILTMWLDQDDARFVKIAKNRYGTSGLSFKTYPDFKCHVWEIKEG